MISVNPPSLVGADHLIVIDVVESYEITNGATGGLLGTLPLPIVKKMPVLK